MKKNITITLATLVFFLSILSLMQPIKTMALASTYYVSTQGNDLNSGTESSPWRTIQKAANTVMPGDTVYIKGGTYNERVILQKSGSQNNHITFSNYPGEQVIIDGTGINWGYNWSSLFNIKNLTLE